MTSKITALILILIGIICVPTDSGTVAQDTTQYHATVVKQEAITPISEAIDSIRVIREEFVNQKEELKDKLSYLEWQQREIAEMQRKIDSVTALK